MFQTRNILIVTFLFAFSISSFAQLDYPSFYEKSSQINNQGMLVLGSWALINMASGAYGWSTTQGEKKYFHQMNLFWNVVNASIAGYALWNTMHIDVAALSNADMLKQHLKTEQLYLINAGLDLLYIGAGSYMLYKSKSSIKRHDLLGGYGKSIILQGGFLLVFDAIMYCVQHTHSQNFLEKSGLQLSLTPNSFAVAFSF